MRRAPYGPKKQSSVVVNTRLPSDVMADGDRDEGWLKDLRTRGRHEELAK